MWRETTDLKFCYNFWVSQKFQGIKNLKLKTGMYFTSREGAGDTKQRKKREKKLKSQSRFFASNGSIKLNFEQKKKKICKKEEVVWILLITEHAFHARKFIIPIRGFLFTHLHAHRILFHEIRGTKMATRGICKRCTPS